MATEDFGPSFYLLCVVAFLSMLSVMITNPVLSIFAMFTMGTLADSIGRKPVLLFGNAATSVLVAVMSVFTSLTIISIIIAVIGFTLGPYGSSGQSSRLRQSHRRGEEPP